MNLFANIDQRFAKKPHKKGFLCADGGSRGNPGVSGAGAVIYDQEKNILWAGGTYTGINTNNFAEYSGLILGLKKANELDITDLEVFLDSKLAIEQMNGNWKVKNANIKPLFEQAKAASEPFEKIAFTHIPRAKNKKADELANKAMDTKKDF